MASPLACNQSKPHSPQKTELQAPIQEPLHKVWAPAGVGPQLPAAVLPPPKREIEGSKNVALQPASGYAEGYTKISIWLQTFLRMYIHTYLNDTTLHYITLHCITLHYIAVHYITSRHVTSRHIISHYSTLYFVAFCYNTLHCITLLTLHYITLHYITSQYIASRQIKSHHIT